MDVISIQDIYGCRVATDVVRMKDGDYCGKVARW